MITVSLRRMWLGSLLAITLAASQPAGSAQTNSTTPAPPMAIIHGPFLQAPSDSGVTISWATTRKCAAKVEYRLATSQQWLSTAPVHHGLIEADTTWHNVPLTGLLPGSNYFYRVVCREIVRFKHTSIDFGATVSSPEREFTVLDPRKASTSFIALNDRHGMVEPLAASLASVNWTNVDLVFLNGDMLSGIDDAELLQQRIVDPCVAGFASHTPLVYVRGNHEARGSFARELLSCFPTDSGRYYYTLFHGPVAFLVLDCGEDKSDRDVEYSGLVDFDSYLEQEVRWLARQVNEPAFQRARFRVCFLHIPPGRKPDAKFIRNRWLMDHVVPLLNQGRVDLLISAHTHRYAVHPAGPEMRFPMVIGGTNTVIRCDVTADQICVESTSLSGASLPQLQPIRAQSPK